jgi:hypothetical protein
MTKDWEKYKQDWLLFTEAGFIAVNQADEDSAMKLFKVGEMLNSENSLPKVGYGYLHLHKLELKPAVKIFQEVLEKEPQNEMVKALLGLCMGMMPTASFKGEKFLEEMSKSEDPDIKNLAETSIDFIEKFVKKAPGPGPAGKGPL